MVISRATIKDKGPQQICTEERQFGLEKTYVTEDSEAYGSDSLHTQYERIRSQVSRVRHGVFLPKLPKDILHSRHAGVIEGKVTYIP